MAQHYYSSTPVATALSAGITAAAATFTVPESASDNGWPVSQGYPFTLAIDYGSVGVELVDVTSKGALAGGIRTWNISRAQDFTVASAHLAGATVRHVIAARDLREARQARSLQPLDTENTYVVRETTAGVEFTDSTVGDFIFKVKTGKSLLFGIDGNGFSSLYVSPTMAGVSTGFQASQGFQSGSGALHGTNYVQLIRASVVQALTANAWNDIAFNNIATVVNDDGAIYNSPWFICQKVGFFQGVATLSFSVLGQKYMRWITQGGSIIAQNDSAAGGTVSCPVALSGPGGGYQIKLQANPTAACNVVISAAGTPSMCYFGQAA